MRQLCLLCHCTFLLLDDWQLWAKTGGSDSLAVQSTWLLVAHSKTASMDATPSSTTLFNWFPSLFHLVTGLQNWLKYHFGVSGGSQKNLPH